MRSYVALRRRGEFVSLRRTGVRCARPTLALYGAPLKAGRSRAGITVGSAVGKAVVRNRVRRRIAAALHELLAGRAPARLVVIAKPLAAQADFHRLRSDLQAALEAGPSTR
jgi:ribonuclease P protein component